MAIMKYFILLVFILVGVAFFTLFERKILGYSHIRFGPNKVSFLGSFQPFTDAIKLFSKEDQKFKDMNLMVYFFSPFFYIFMSVFVWVIISFWGIVFFSKYSLIFFVFFIGMGVYFLLFSGWSSNSKFSLLGGCRSSAQSVSYEVVMLFSILLMFFFWCVLGFMEFFFFSYGVSFFMLLFSTMVCWLFSCLAESNRSPFDFSEGESELVSGFNTEYGGGLFSFIFIGEYSFILMLSFVSSLFLFDHLYFFLFFSFVSFFYLWVRSTFARFRYDFLMEISWKSLVFLVLSSFLMYFVFF